MVASPEFDIVVIGGGSGGLVVAAGGSTLGAKVALVEKHKLGGDCLWYGCVPSKTLIKSAQVAFEMRNAQRWALAPSDPQPNLARVMERVREVIAGIEPFDSPERFRGLGVDVVFGEGCFTSPDVFEVNGRRPARMASSAVATAGSPIPRSSGVPALTNAVFDWRRRRRIQRQRDRARAPSIRPPGSQVGRRHRHLVAARRSRSRGGRSPATGRGRHPLSLRHHDREVAGARAITATLRGKEGAERVATASHLLVAAGRRINTEGLGLEAAGVTLDQGRIVVDAKLRTTNPNVYVVGDVAGGYQFTHLAEHHAGIVLRHAIFKLARTGR
jgi:pyruvate/2-oxoglutarate dehydrogenase complex dihydrolipoamide dehydrogenase (E3) component